MNQSTVTAHVTSFHRKSKRSVGKHPVPCPQPQSSNAQVIRRRRGVLTVVQA